MGPTGHHTAAITATLAARLSNGFVLDLVKLGGSRRDVIDALLRATIAHSNQSHLMRAPDLKGRYATLDDDVPDDLRHPASMNAIAGSLRIPFETVRRRVHGLAEAGVCVITDRGVIVPRAATSSPIYRAGCQIQYEMVRKLYGALRTIGFLEPWAAAGVSEAGTPPVRLAGRVVVEYVLRFADLILARLDDIVTTVTLMEMIHANTEHLGELGVGAVEWTAQGLVPDDLRRPVSVAVIAEHLGISHETVRRRVMRLREQGLCRKTRGGDLVTAEILATEPFVRFIADNQAYLKRLFGQLAESGILAAWEDQWLATRAA